MKYTHDVILDMLKYYKGDKRQVAMRLNLGVQTVRNYITRFPDVYSEYKQRSYILKNAPGRPYEFCHSCGDTVSNLWEHLNHCRRADLYAQKGDQPLCTDCNVCMEWTNLKGTRWNWKDFYRIIKVNIYGWHCPECDDIQVAEKQVNELDRLLS